MGTLTGKVAIVSGAARGQGRAHAVTLARLGASVVAFDLCEKLEHALTPGATVEDLAETARLVEEQGGRCISERLDVRDLEGLTTLARRTMDELGRVDIVVGNAGLWSIARNTWELEEASWVEAVDIMLTGNWKLCRAFAPRIIAGGRGGSIVLTGSTQAVVPQPGAAAYTAAKHGLMGLMKVLAYELGEHSIRVNAINPGGVGTPMALSGGTADLSASYWPDWMSRPRHVLPIDDQMVAEDFGVMSPQAIADAMGWLVSDEARYVTGAMIPVDAGWAAL